MLTYVELVELVESGVIDAPLELVNGASIDVRLASLILVEREPLPDEPRRVDLSQKQSPVMVELEIKNEYALQPGQFILAHTLETFNLPEDIACEFMLKSSIARTGLNHLKAGWCFTGDTKIPLLDGSVLPISAIDLSKDTYVYSLNDKGDIVPGKVTRSGVSGYVSDTVKVTLDSGEQFECTPEHSVMMRNGKYKEASTLIVGESLMPFYSRLNSEGHHEVYHPSLVLKSNWKNPKGRWGKTHRLVYEAMFGTIKQGEAVHHKDHCKTNNHPSNLVVMDAKDHLLHHNPDAYAAMMRPEIREKISRNTSAHCHRLWADDDFRRRKAQLSSEKMASRNKERWSKQENRQEMSVWAKENDVAASLRRYQEENPGCCRVNAISGKFRKNIYRMVDAGMIVNEASYVQHKGQSAPSVCSLNDVFGSFDSALTSIGYTNHKVASVEFVKRPCTIPVYDMTVEEHHNFALESGVFVHNCDPHWYGSALTMELKNDTQFHTLILKPGMKIGQMVFFRGTPVPREHSYAVKGRYNQTMTVTASKGV